MINVKIEPNMISKTTEMIYFTHFPTFLKIPRRVKSSNLGTKPHKWEHWLQLAANYTSAKQLQNLL